MRPPAKIHPLELFSCPDTSIEPLVTSWVVSNALRTYRITISDFAALTGVSQFALVGMMSHDAPLVPAVIRGYRELREYEALMVSRFRRSASAINTDVLQWPRFFSDRHLLEFSPNDWEQFGNVRIVTGVQKRAAAYFEERAGVAVSFVDFNEITYEMWLEKYQLDHTPRGILEWASRQAG